MPKSVSVGVRAGSAFEQAIACDGEQNYYQGGCANPQQRALSRDVLPHCRLHRGSIGQAVGICVSQARVYLFHVV